MARTKISEFSATPASNTDIDSIFIGEGMAPSNVNDAIRELMAQLKDFQVGSAGDPVTVGGVLTVQAGSASTPALTTAGDTNTGMFFPAADTIAFAEGGAEAMRLDASGNMGLGVTPSAWGSGRKILQMTNGAAFGDYSGFTGLSRNYYQDGSTDRYIANGFAERYLQGSGQHLWYTAASGTAGNAITFTQAMTLTAAGNLLLGTTSYTEGAMAIYRSDSTASAILFYNGATGTTGNDGLYVGLGGANGVDTYFYNRENSSVIFGTNNIERARIDSSGRLLVDCTIEPFSVAGIGLSPGGASYFTRSSAASIWASRLTTTGDIIALGYAGVQRGSISTDGSSISYNTSSDYRLKNTIAPMTGALAKVAQLKPVTYKWNTDGSDGQGFIAHELAEVCPNAVNGEKDAVDEDGKPQYQGIDTSFLVATLTAAIQEQQAIIENLKARLDAANL